MFPDVEEMATIVVDAMKEALDPLDGRLTVLEGRTAVIPRDGRDGKDAPEPDLDLITAKVLTGLPDQIAELVTREVTKAMSAIALPKDGRDGIDGQNGKDGRDGTSVTMEDISAVVATEVTKAIKARPSPEDASPEDIAAALAAFVKQELMQTLQPLPTMVTQKRIVRDQHGRIERVVDEPVEVR